MQFGRRRLLARLGDIKRHRHDLLVEADQSHDHHQARDKRHVIRRRMIVCHPTEM
jgi:hypothetical protein